MVHLSAKPDLTSQSINQHQDSLLNCGFLHLAAVLAGARSEKKHLPVAHDQNVLITAASLPVCGDRFSVKQLNLTHDGQNTLSVL